jgi:predicted RNase H-like nuclease
VTFHAPCVVPASVMKTTLETRCAITSGVRGVALFMAELDDLCKLVRMYHGQLTVAKLAADRVGNVFIAMRTSDQLGGILPPQFIVSATRDSAPIWRQWMRRDVAVHDFEGYLAAIDFAEVGGEVARCANDVIRQHPDLAERYVSIRDQVAATRVSHGSRLPAVFPVVPAR